MLLKATSILAAGALLLSLMTACGGSSGVRVTEGSEPVGAVGAASRTPQANDVTIVHVNERERLATMRSGHRFSDRTFLKTIDRGGNQTGFLKTRVQRPSGLRTADILEGRPNINDRVVPVSGPEQSRLEKLYRDPEDTTN
ncbi:MAG: hypothetical protein GVY36_00650 [Verrucomicrobia bacterium]|jgi:hypothetical protein|nr:hypothetical protein [Verrucomicrobiota bacterium]